MSTRSLATGALALATIATLTVACQSGLSIGGLGGKKPDDARAAADDDGEPDRSRDRERSDDDGPDDGDADADAETEARPEKKSAAAGRGSRKGGRAADAAAALDACYARLIRDASLRPGECQAQRDAYLSSRGIKGPSDRDITGAARALFGEGLTIEKSGRAMTISDGALDRRTLERYAREMYLPAILSNTSSPAMGVYRHRRELDNEKEYESFKALSQSRKWGFILTEPTSRMMLCDWLAEALDDKAAGKKLKLWCFDEGMRAARLPVYLYRPGKPRTIEPDAEQDDYPVDGEAYVPREDGSAWKIQVAVSGTTPIESYAVHRSIDFAGLVLTWEDDPELKKKGHELRAQLQEVDAAKRAAAHKAMARKVGPRGKLMWTDVPLLDPWKPFPAMTSNVPACEALTLAVWEPTRRPDRVTGWYVEVSIDGDDCFDDEIFEPSDRKPGPIFRTALAGKCKVAKGRQQHKIATVLRQLVHYKTDEKRARISDDEIEVYDVHGSRPDKVLARESLVCSGGL
jgi:hypothetical protein